MKATAASYRYAQSLFQLATEKKVVDKVKVDMELIAKTIASSSELEQMLQSPIIKTDAKQKVLNSIFGKLVSELSISFMNLLTSKNREGILFLIAQSFETIYNEANGIVIAEVISATSLTDAQRNEVKKMLSTLGKTVELKESANPSILGGLQVKVGDLRVDASVRRKLNDLKTELSKNKLSAIN